MTGSLGPILLDETYGQPSAEEFVAAPVKGAAFVRVRYVPRDEATRCHIETLASELGFDADDEAAIRCLCGIHVAVRSAMMMKGSDLICFSGTSNDYVSEPVGYRDVARVMARLKAAGFLKTVVLPSHKGSTIYRAIISDDRGLRFTERAPSLIRIREPKPDAPAKSKGRLVSRRSAVKRFGEQYLGEEKRLQRLSDFLRHHPLETPDGDTLHVMKRIYNDGRMDRGGRLYGDWQTMKERDRLNLTIDGRPVCEIDVKASHLFLAFATAEEPVLDEDPYQRVDFVAGEPGKRALAKRLIVAIIGKGSPLSKFPKGFRNEFGLGKEERLGDYQEPILEAYPKLRELPASVLQLMHIESEIILSTMETLMKQGIPSYPVHDCLICREDDHEPAIQALQSEMVNFVGCSPALEVTFLRRKKRTIQAMAGEPIHLQ